MKSLPWKEYLSLVKIARIESTDDWRIHITHDGYVFSYSAKDFRHREFWETRDIIVEDLSE